MQGKTPAQLRSELMKRYAVQLQHPQLAVIVKSFYERQVYVGGAVKKPGPVLMPGEMTAMEAVMDAGGLNAQTAEPRNVIVVRNVDDRMVGRAIDPADPHRRCRSVGSATPVEAASLYRHRGDRLLTCERTGSTALHRTCTLMCAGCRSPAQY